jgi:opine dehydrogenase
VGTGAGGSAIAADLSVRGNPVRLYGRSAGAIELIRERHGIALTLEDGQRTFGRLQMATSRADEAIDGAGIIVVAVPAYGHRAVAATCAPLLRSGQLVVLVPGRTGGALEFSHALRGLGCVAEVVIAETETLPYVSRLDRPGEVRILRRKSRVMAAALPACGTPYALARLSALFPQLVGAPTVLATSLTNLGAVIHPALAMLNLGRIEDDGEFLFYAEGLTASIMPVVARLDSERLAVASAMGVTVPSMVEWLSAAYPIAACDMLGALRDRSVYGAVAAPRTARHRYIWEDVPYGLVPVAELGGRLGVHIPCTDAVICLASASQETDYRRDGRTMARMGLAGLTVEQIRRVAERGTVP